MKKGDLYYCDKCGKGVIMSWTCPQCNRLICDTCSGMSDPAEATPKNIGAGISVMSLGGGEPECPFCDKGEPVPESATTETSTDLKEEMFRDIPTKQRSFRDEVMAYAGNAAPDISKYGRMVSPRTGYPNTPQDGIGLFSTTDGATCIFALGDYGDEMFAAAGQAARDGIVALNVGTHCYSAYPVIQFVVWIHSSGFFRETLGDIGDGNIQDFVSDLCTSRCWKLIYCRYDPAQEEAQQRLVDPVEVDLSISPSDVETIKEQIRRARDHYLSIDQSSLDFQAAAQEFMEAGLPVGEMPAPRKTHKQQTGVKKVPCSKCGALILPQTAERTGGVCMRCVREAEPAPTPESDVQDTESVPAPKSDRSCFIATACYGDYDSPEVRTLRAFRDEVLLQHWFGKVVTQLYYSVSPPLARWLTTRPGVSALVKSRVLTPLVKLVRNRTRRLPNKAIDSDKK